MFGLFLGKRDDPMQVKSLLPLKKWNTSKVTTMVALLQCNSGLTSLEGLENWDTSKVTNMGTMFHECHKLTDASAIKNWDVSNVENMRNMFNISDSMNPKYSKLKQLDVSNWNMKSVKSYSYWVESLTLVSMNVTIRST